MRFSQMILMPVARVAGLHSAVLLKKFLCSHSDTKNIQGALLKELIKAHCDTQFGRDFGLKHVKTYEDFKRAIPVATYDRYMPYINSMLDGDYRAMLPAGQDPLMFSMTSGTTADPKYIPVTPRFLTETKRTWNAFGYNMLRQHLDAWVRPILQVTSLMREKVTSKGIACGAISGLMTATQKKIVRKMYCVPTWIAEIAEPENRFYSVIRHAIEKDVSWTTTANPSTVLKIISAGQQFAPQLIKDIADGTYTMPDGTTPNQYSTSSRRFRPNPRFARHLQACLDKSGKLAPKHYWNLSFLANWTGGTLGLYTNRLREYFPTQPIYDIGLIASEGRFSIPLEANTPAGVAEITSNFLEFMPVDQRESQNPETLRAHEVEIGQEYFLVFSNWTGLLRYNLDDRVRITGFYENTPKFEFLCRGLHTANITGEKITESQVVEAMRRTKKQLGLNIERFTLQGVFHDPAFYELKLESLSPDQSSKTAHLLDQNLAEINIEYASKRQSARLGPIQPIVYTNAEFDQIERDKILKRKGRSEQYKHQYLLTEIIKKPSCNNR